MTRQMFSGSRRSGSGDDRNARPVPDDPLESFAARRLSSYAQRVSTVPLSFRELGIRYSRPGEDDLVIVDDLTLDVAAGEMHCLAGRSGSGKTSILKAAAGLTRPTTGAVLWSGDDIGTHTDDAVTAFRRRHVGYLDQGGILIQGLTALENVLLPAVPDGQTRALAGRARDLLGRLGVGARMRARPEQLSGGERQRVALARALLFDPGVLVVDEPTASLDRTSADAVIGLLRSIAGSGTAVLVSAHDQVLIDAADSRTVMV
jgi:ABC-type lipoprotein export system ATPase subunit